MNDDGSFVVNGISVAISPLSKVGARLQPGDRVKVDGVATLEGSVLAAEIKTKGAQPKDDVAELEISGRLEVVNRGAGGQVSAVRVAGLRVSIDSLTEIDASLQPGVEVKIKAILKEGVIIAHTTEGRAGGPPSEIEPEIKIRGRVDRVDKNADGVVVGVTIGGVEVDVEQGDNLGGLEAGQSIQLEGRAQQEGVVADNIGRDEPPEASERREFELEGSVDDVVRDENGNIVGLVIDGQPVSADLLSRVTGPIFPGNHVAVEGVISDGEFVAAEVSGKSDDDDDASRQSGKGSGKSDDDDDDAPGQSGNGSGKSDDDAPGKSGDAPWEPDEDEDALDKSGNVPRQSDDDDDARGRSGNASRRSGDARGQLAVAPGQSDDDDDDARGQLAVAPGQSDDDDDDARGQLAVAPGQSGDDDDDARGRSGNASRRSGDARGQSGDTPGRSNDKPGKKGKG